MRMRIVMLFDLDYFFAQCEELRNPLLKDKPVVVCVFSGRTEDSGAVSTANYVARKYGVKSGMPIYVAKKKLQGVDAFFLPVDRPFYEEISGRIMSLFRSYADDFEQVGIDEAYLDVTEKTRGNFKHAFELAQEMKQRLRNTLGLTCSIGIGPSKLVAKIAADASKPDGLTVVEPENVVSFLSPLPVDRLLGVGRKTVERMRLMGVTTIGDLAVYDVQKLAEVFGKKLGSYFHEAANGVDEEPVRERGEAESISRIATLKVDTHDIEAVAAKINVLSEEVHSRLMERGAKFKTVGIIAVMSDLSIRSRAKSFDNPTSDLEVLKKTGRELFDKLLSEYELPVKRVGVKVSNLASDEQRQSRITRFLQNSNG